AASARQKQAKKRSLRGVNEHFERVFNAAMATQVVFEAPLRAVVKQVRRQKVVKRFRVLPLNYGPAVLEPTGFEPASRPLEGVVPPAFVAKLKVARQGKVTVPRCRGPESNRLNRCTATCIRAARYGDKGVQGHR
ncbi:hypothetical protein R0G64_16820, partial [Pseudomonas otitidis]|nr:hypothetical protein [Pseudomonas otitidis]